MKTDQFQNRFYSNWIRLYNFGLSPARGPKRSFGADQILRDRYTGPFYQISDADVNQSVTAMLGNHTFQNQNSEFFLTIYLSPKKPRKQCNDIF